ncbi:MAG: hypothetical protein ACPW61_06995 [Methyloligella sp. ZOD6]
MWARAAVAALIVLSGSVAFFAEDHATASGDIFAAVHKAKLGCLLLVVNIDVSDLTKDVQSNTLLPKPHDLSRGILSDFGFDLEPTAAEYDGSESRWLRRRIERLGQWVRAQREAGPMLHTMSGRLSGVLNEEAESERWPSFQIRALSLIDSDIGSELPMSRVARYESARFGSVRRSIGSIERPSSGSQVVGQKNESAEADYYSFGAEKKDSQSPNAHILLCFKIVLLALFFSLSTFLTCKALLILGKGTYLGAALTILVAGVSGMMWSYVLALLLVLPVIIK